MRNSHPRLSIAASLLIVSATLGGCAYNREMAKETARSDELQRSLDSVGARGQAEQHRTIGLKAERKQLSEQIAVNKRTLGSLEAQRATINAKPIRTPRDDEDLEGIKSQIDRLQKQNAEKQRRIDNLNRYS